MLSHLQSGIPRECPGPLSGRYPGTEQEYWGDIRKRLTRTAKTRLTSLSKSDPGHSTFVSAPLYTCHGRTVSSTSLCNPDIRACVVLTQAPQAQRKIRFLQKYKAGCSAASHCSKFARTQTSSLAIKSTISTIFLDATSASSVPKTRHKDISKML